jgi:hypothetical protein
VFIYSGPTLNLSASILAGSFLILLPLSGGNGLLYVPGIAAWTMIRACYNVEGSADCGNSVKRFIKRSAPSLAARARIIMLGSSAASIAISIGYLVGFKRVSHPWPAPDVQQFISATGHVLGSGFGRYFDRLWPLSGVASASLVAAGFAYAVRTGFHRQRSPILRSRALDIAAFMIAFMPVAVGVAYARGGQPPLATTHYSTLALPILYWSFMSWSLDVPRPPAKFIQTVLCVIMSILSIKYASNAVHNGKDRILKIAEIEHELRNGVASDIIVDRHMLDLCYMDTPQLRKLVQDGIDKFRDAGFAQYGGTGRTH